MFPIPRAIVTRDMLFDVAAISAAIESTLDDMATDAAADFEAHQATWSEDNKTPATIKRVTHRRTIDMNTFEFRRVDKDTPPRIIRPKRAKYLRFRPNYKRKTTRGRIPSRRGGSSGDYVYAKEVNHPGSKGSDISGTVHKKYKAAMPRYRAALYARIKR